MTRDIQNLKISEATVQNWKRLDKNLEQACFFKRANKTQSRKKIIPKEYINLDSEIDLILDEIDFDRPIETTINSLILKYLLDLKLLHKTDKSFYSKNRYITDFINTFGQDYYQINFDFNAYFCVDLLGYIYQQLKYEGEKNISGSYYTPASIVHKMIKGLDLKDKKICDPCCGSGGFLNEIAKTKSVKPENIYGYDIDKIAVKIMKCNLFAIFKDEIFEPNIYCADFLKISNNIKFDLIITNPPWGAYIEDRLNDFKEIKSKESFSYFIYQSIQNTNKKEGRLCFLLPESFLNVRTHRDIRKYIVKNTAICKIEYFKKPFNGVLTDAVSIELAFTLKNQITITQNSNEHKITYNRYETEKDYIFSLYDDEKNSILNKIEQVDCFKLTNSKFALGIVTGNNKKLVLDHEVKDSMPIYTGKEIKKYIADKPKKFILYNKEKFQQVASDKYYFAPEKLIYKFISNKKLIFSYDNKKTLVLNSANILIPVNTPVNIKALCVLLNSNVLNFYFRNKINQIKTLKYDLQNLPIPNINTKTEQLFEDFIDGKVKDESKIQCAIYSLYGFSNEEIKMIEKDLQNGKT